jgi:hypothetical protein
MSSFMTRTRNIGTYTFPCLVTVARDSGHKPIAPEGKERLLSALVLCRSTCTGCADVDVLHRTWRFLVDALGKPHTHFIKGVNR